MRSVFRPTTPADAAAISLLMQEVFAMPASHPSFSPETMDWNYWRPHPDWTGSRGYVIEREGSIQAHGAVIPLRWARGAERRRMVHLIDWAARPTATGAGIALMTNVAREAGGIFAAGGSEMTEKILPALGFRESGRATRFALPMRPLARFRHETISSWRPFARLARNLMWKFQAPPGDVSGWSARRIPAGDLESGGRSDFPLPHRAGEAVFERSVPVIAHWLACPLVPFEFYLVQRQGSVRGYFLLTRVHAQCRIADAWIEPDRMEDWRALYLLAARAAKADRHTAELVTVATGAEAEVLAQAGFRARGQVTLRFSSPGAAPDPGAAPMPARYQMVDSDAAFLQDSCPSFWS